MATLEDLARQDAHLRSLAGIVHAVAGEGGRWIAVLLDARYDQNGGFSHKVRVERADGSTDGPSLPVAGTLELIALGQARPDGPDRWHGLVLRVTAAGACETTFNYDPACADDTSFFES